MVVFCFASLVSFPSLLHNFPWGKYLLLSDGTVNCMAPPSLLKNWNVTNQITSSFKHTDKSKRLACSPLIFFFFFADAISCCICYKKKKKDPPLFFFFFSGITSFEDNVSLDPSLLLHRGKPG